MKDEQGRVVMWVGTNTDVHERKESENKLQETQERLQLTLSAGAISTWIWDIVDNRVYADEVLSKVFGIKSAEGAQGLELESFTNAIHPDDRPEVQNLITKAIETGEDYEAEYRVYGADEKLKWVIARGKVKYDEKGNPISFPGLLLDITDRKIAEEALENRNQELQRINNDLDNFIYTASHDLKAPITNIEGLIHLLVRHLSAESLETPVIDKVISMMGTSVERFKNTINDLTELTKLQRSMEDDISLVHLPKLFEEICLDLETAIQSSGAKLTVDFKQCPSIRFSKKNLRSILYNLVSNAIKYHSPEREPLIHVSSKLEQDFCVLTVEDNGLGMDLSQESKIFAMFKRLHDHVEGTGVGLYIVKKVIENSGGKIKVESEVGKGSTFKVYFNYK
jgi:PAS domain S-box-containing protein